MLFDRSCSSELVVAAVAVAVVSDAVHKGPIHCWSAPIVIDDDRHASVVAVVVVAWQIVKKWSV